MKVKDFIELLKKIPEDFEVLIAQDEEGNGFDILGNISKECAEIRDEIDLIHPEDFPDYYPNEEYKHNAIVLWP